jgi:hypothetical protein
MVQDMAPFRNKTLSAQLGAKLTSVSPHTMAATMHDKQHLLFKNIYT